MEKEILPIRIKTEVRREKMARVVIRRTGRGVLSVRKLDTMPTNIHTWVSQTGTNVCKLDI